MKKQTTHHLLAAAFFAAATFPSLSLRAAEETDERTNAAAQRMMKVMEVEKQMTPVLHGVKNMQDAMIEQQELSEKEKAEARQIMAASMGEVEKALSWETLEPMLMRVYTDTFTPEEMNDLSSYFESPQGQAYIKKQPKLQQAMMAEMQTLMAGLMPKIQKRTQEVIKQIKNGETPEAN